MEYERVGRGGGGVGGRDGDGNCDGGGVVGMGWSGMALEMLASSEDRIALLSSSSFACPGNPNAMRKRVPLSSVISRVIVPSNRWIERCTTDTALPARKTLSLGVGVCTLYWIDGVSTQEYRSTEIGKRVDTGSTGACAHAAGSTPLPCESEQAASTRCEARRARRVGLLVLHTVSGPILLQAQYCCVAGERA